MQAADRIAGIKAAYEREQINPPKAVRLGDIPVSYEAITPEWMTAVLCAKIPSAAVTGLSLDAVDNGTSNRRRIFVEYNEAGRDARLPASVFCKATHDLVNRIVLSSTGTYSEVAFYNRVRPLLDIDTPAAFLAAYDPESWASIIVLEDIGDEVEFCSDKTEMDRASVESQLSLLAKMHGRLLDSPELKGPLSDLFTFRNRFQRLIDGFGLEKCCRDGFDAAEEVIPARLFARASEIWPATMRAVDHHRDLPETFTHSDVHLKNWYIRNRPAMGLSDWQSCGRGHWSRDLAYCVSTALTAEDRRTLERDLVRYYVDALSSASGQKIDFDDAFRLYREQMLGALAWWTLTLRPSSDMPDMQPLDTTLTFLGRIATAMDDLDTLDV
jgi:hypothetical protein